MTRRAIPFGCVGDNTCDCPTCEPDAEDLKEGPAEVGPYRCGGCGIELTSSLDCPDRCHIRINAEMK